MASNPFQEELNKRNPFEAELDKRGATAGAAFSESAIRSFLNNALALPSAVGEVGARGLAGTAAALEGGSALLTGGDLNFTERATEQLGKQPSLLLGSIPKPTVEGIMASFRSLPALLPGGESFGERKETELSGIQAKLGGLREQFPGASTAGDVAGDVGTILTGRVPLAKGINKLEKSLLVSKLPKITDPGTIRLVTRIIDAKSVRLLARGAGRSLEAGFEAAALDLLKGDDPLETAAYAAGAQASGSVLLTAGKGLVSGGPLKAGAKLGLAAVSFGAILQLVKETAPGGEDNLIDSVKTGFEKVWLAMILGMVSTAAGTGRLRGGKLAEDWPKITDAIATIPRASMISLLEDFVDSPPEDQQTIETVINKLTEDPLFFGKEITPKLQSAMEGGRFAEELRELQKDRKFRQKLFSLRPPTFEDAIPRLSNGE